MFKFAVLILLIVAVLLPAAPAEASTENQTCVYTTHTVRSVRLSMGGRRAQTLAEVARAHNTTSSHIRSLNPNIVLDPLMVGQTLNVWHCNAPLAAPTPTPRPYSGYRCMITADGHLVCPARTR